MADSIYTVDDNGNAGMRISNAVVGPKESIYGTDANGNAAVRVIGDPVGGGSAATTAEAVAVNSAGLKIVTTPNLQRATEEIDSAIFDLQGSASVLTTIVDLGEVGTHKQIALDELEIINNMDGRPSYKDAGALVYGPNGSQAIIDSVDETGGTAMITTTVAAFSSESIRAEYCSKYGIIKAPNGLIDYSPLSKTVVVKAGMQLLCQGDDGKVQIASDTEYEVQANVDVSLFYVDGHITEGRKYFQPTAPEDGAEYALAWQDGQTWRFKSNDTGNTWRSGEKVCWIGDLHITNGTINRIDYVGCRHLNDVPEIPTLPMDEGTYVLKATVNATGDVTLSWVAE